MKTSPFVIALVIGFAQIPKNLSIFLDNEFDVQTALVAITLRLPPECPIVLIFDEQMPTSRRLIKEMHQNGYTFIGLDLSERNHPILGKMYGSNKTSEILEQALFRLYRRSRCYIFHVWVKDPRILYPETIVKYHPGWRNTDYIILMAYHITKRYKYFIGLRFWKFIPNIVALKRWREDVLGIAINIFTVLPYYKDGKRKSQEIDVWLVKRQMFLKNNTLFFRKFENFHNASIVLGVNWKDPFFIWGNIKDPYLDGLDWRLFMLCKDKLDFSFTFMNIESVGHRIEDETWNGMLGLLANGSIDVGTGGISVTSERRQFFDFCRTYYTDSYNFIAPLNGDIDSALDTFRRPFKNEVWIVGFLAALIGIVALKLTAYFEKRIVQTKEDAHFMSMWNNYGLLITLLCQKPYRYVPKGAAVKFVHFGLFAMIVFLGMAFSSCLISVLLGLKRHPIADKVNDICETGLQIAIRNYDGNFNDYMQHSGNRKLQEIFHKSKLVSYYESFKAMDNVVEGGSIYIDSKAKLEFSGKYLYSGKHGLKFHISSESLLQFDSVGWAVVKNWPFIPKVDDIISRAVEGGIVQHWMSQFRQGRFGGSKEAWKIPMGSYLQDKQITPDVSIPHLEKNSFVPLSTIHVRGVLTIYAIGLISATLIFVGECVLSMGSAGVQFVSLRISKAQSIGNQSIKIKINKSQSDKKISKKMKTREIKVKSKASQFPQLIWEDFKNISVN